MPNAWVTIRAELAGGLLGSRTMTIASPVLNSAIGEERPAVALLAGDNTIDVPDGARYVFLAPKWDNTKALELRRTAGVDGHPLHTALASAVTLADGTGRQIIVNAEDAITVALAFV